MREVVYRKKPIHVENYFRGLKSHKIIFILTNSISVRFFEIMEKVIVPYFPYIALFLSW